MGIRVNKQVGKGTSVSIGVGWLLAVGACFGLCLLGMAIQAVSQYPWTTAGVVLAVVALTVWLVRMHRRARRR